jgi:hypothetical protein
MTEPPRTSPRCIGLLFGVAIGAGLSQQQKDWSWWPWQN